MALITAQKIVDQARILLQDVTGGGVRWLDAEMLIWVNAAQRAVASYKPDASIVNTAVVLIEGTKQTIPAGGIMLNKIMRNMGTNGTTPGPAVRIVDQEIFDAQNPDWHTDTASAVVKNYMWDKKDPTVFYVYPPQPSSAFGYVEMSYPTSPVDLSALSDTIGVLDIYANAILDYVMYRSLSKDSTYTKKGIDAEIYNRGFLTAVGAIDLNKQRGDPNRNIGNPNANLAAAQEDA